MITSLILFLIAAGFKMLIDWLATINEYFSGWTIVGTVTCIVMGVYAFARVMIAIFTAIFNARNSKYK